ncbi:GlsB/YeaQ/YmgE family stress response membrane protein [Vitiosangium sp. GDMCC 1.1324]|uniref:GlsB/YeaQ/YmgE family stress response membrane protein n=1 Tax=Vitiosangium sp. (strain GDMCC 1.1324) TaxID=2138576 RepID=UPI000D34B535|nr:GlsB/YeaQ/YmgE family stress response membrane protein [Vitiosangium sp. GDMCC 1.1324]PTL82268.1 GlsB/YeaQ/YmgE family stress response membrane protein [Vitiosangium sp. GDMCC 1.1324]
MAIYAYALIGFILGIIARVALPSTRLVGFWGSALLGAAGGVIGALIASIFIPGGVTTGIQPLGVVLAIIGSALVSVGVIVFTRNKRFA